MNIPMKGTSIHRVLYLLCTFNVVFTSWHVFTKLRKWHGRPQEHSYIGEDYPLELPVRPLPVVEMQLQESLQFSLVGPGTDEAWETLTTYPPGWGWVRLGPGRRLFAVVMFHQLHCLRMIQRAFVNQTDPMAGPHHVEHCLNYLRQSFLCEAADDLEEGDFLARDYERERMGSVLVCEDWTKVYEFAERNFREWKEWASNNGICRISDGEYGDGICR